jgi:hypothetical protein
MSSTNVAIQATNDLIVAIKQPTLATPPFAPVGNKQKEAIKELAKLL